jgi:putative Holliday junction resolvase
MGRIMAFDYGTKRVGVAVTDALQLIATALDTVHSSQILDFIQDYVSRESVDCFVVGEPRRLDNTPSETATDVNGFIQRLRKRFANIPVCRIDERFTSVMAMQSMIENGMKKKDRRNKALTDQISAVLILQSYLEQINKSN